MKIIFIRGLPGTGKTAVSEILEKIFYDSELIRVDKFKLQAMKKGEDFEESQKIAYEKTSEKLNSINKKCVIVDDLICDKDFYNKLRNFLDKNGHDVYWFRLLRPLEKLLEVEAGRKRKIKNPEEDFVELKEEIEFCKIEDEVWIKNDSLALTIKKILDVVV